MRWLGSILLLAIPLFTGCGTMKVTEDKARSATAYEHTATSNAGD